MPLRRLPALLLVSALFACNAAGESSSDGSEGNTTDAAACMLTPEPGSCDAAFERYAFDDASQRCVPFTWGGCDGVVPFETLVTCQSACEPCERFFSTTTPTPTYEAAAITVRNDSAAPIYLAMHSSGGGAVGFRRNAIRVTPVGADAPLITAPNICDFSCADYNNETCDNQCSDDGHPPGPIVLQPGEVYTGGWSGLYFGQVSLPDRCLPAACEPGLECGRWLETAPGSFTVGATVATAWNCIDPACPCTTNADGYCQLDAFDAQQGAVDPVALSGDLSFPGGAVELAWSP